MAYSTAGCRRQPDGGTRLDLTEDKRPAVAGDDVQFTPPGPIVALHDGESEALEVAGRKRLAVRSELSATVIRHPSRLRPIVLHVCHGLPQKCVLYRENCH